MQRLLGVSLGEPFLLGPACGESLEGGDFLAVGGRERRDTGADFLAVEQDGTGSALGYTTSELRSGQLELVAQDVEQGGVGGRLDLAPGSVDDHRDHENAPLRRFGASLAKKAAGDYWPWWAGPAGRHVGTRSLALAVRCRRLTTLGPYEAASATFFNFLGSIQVLPIAPG